MNKPLVLAILDGYGLNPSRVHNAIYAARKPVLDGFFASFPHSLLRCSGLDVGLTNGQMGNSEVGHTNIGAGRVVFTDLARISLAIENGSFFNNLEILNAIAEAKAKNGAVHLMGLVSNGGVHSHMTHIFALLRLCAREGVKTWIHCFLDGRDTPPQSGAEFVRQVEREITATGGDAHIASVMGRFYAMDRDKRWERLKMAYSAIVFADSPRAQSPSDAVERSYDAGVTDEFVLPLVCGDYQGLSARDSVVFFNFRSDRAREITRALVDADFDGFERSGGVICPRFVCMTQYDASMPNVSVAFAPQPLDGIFGEYISQKGLRQLRIAETEKYAHVTLFFNGGEEKQFIGESRILVPSPKVATYDLQPEMSAFEVAEKCSDAVLSGDFDVVVLNFANCDMVGHTGSFEAAVRAVEAVDECIGIVYNAVCRAGGLLLVTADHGNAELMWQDGAPFTAHTTNNVPFILCRKGYSLRDGALCDIAPTMLELLELAKPAQMTGKSLILG